MKEEVVLLLVGREQNNAKNEKFYEARTDKEIVILLYLQHAVSFYIQQTWSNKDSNRITIRQAKFLSLNTQNISQNGFRNLVMSLRRIYNLFF